MRPARAAAWMALAVAGAAAAVVALSHGAEAQIPASTSPTILTGTTMPFEADNSVAVYTGTRYYIFGGWDEDSAVTNKIAQFDPATMTASMVPTLLPVPKVGMAGVWTGSAIYLFGGQGGTGREIYRFDPATATLTTLPATLPDPFYGFGDAVWHGGAAYIFGAPDAPLLTAANTKIFKFDPATGTVSTLPVMIGGTMVRGSVQSDGTFIYVVGATTASSTTSIQRLDPAAMAVTTLPVSLPYDPFAATSVWDGLAMWIFGGTSSPTSIVRFVPSAMSVSIASGTMPIGIWDLATDSSVCGSFIFGGSHGMDTGTDLIQQFGSAALCPVPGMPVTPEIAVTYAVIGSDCLSATYHFDWAGTAGFFTEFLWDFGDGDTSTASAVDHTYGASGAYLVKLTAKGTDNATYERSAVVNVAIASCPPQLLAPPPLYVDAGTDILVCLVAIAGGGGDLAFSATLMPTGSAFDPAGPCFTWTPTPRDAGLYPCVRFRVVEAPTGLADEKCLLVRVRPPPPIPHSDVDHDGIEDAGDNCPFAPNRDQADRDRDAVGDVCDEAADTYDAPHLMQALPPDVPDRDADGVPDEVDICPDRADGAQLDVDGDGVGDVCDTDADGDGIAEQGPKGSLLDNCPWLANRDQADADGDGQGDACKAAAARAGYTVPAPQAEAPAASAPDAWPAIAAAVAVPAAVVAGLAAWLRRRA